MTEFVLGAVVAAYVIGAAAFVWDIVGRRPWQGLGERRRTRWDVVRQQPWYYWPLIALWPVSIVVATAWRYVVWRLRR
jgi:hypothetical protein